MWLERLLPSNIKFDKLFPSNISNSDLWLVAGATAVASVVLPATVIFSYHLYLSTPRKGEVRIRWSWLPILGHGLEMGQRPIEMLQESAQECGEIFGLVLGGQRVFIVADPFSSEVIIKPNKDFSWEEFHNSVLTQFFGVSQKVIDSHHMDEDLMRKYYHQYLLSDKHLYNLTLRVFEQMRRDIDCVKPGRQSFYKFIGKLIFRASIGSMFNADAAAEGESLYSSFMKFDDKMSLSLAGCPLSWFPEAVEGRRKVTQACSQHTKGQSELMEIRLKYFQEKVKEGKLDEEEIAKMQLAIFWASVSNTMPAAFWAIFFLIQQPELLSQVMQEIKTLLPNYYQDRAVTYEALGKMTLMDACFTETLRLTSGSLMMRQIRRDCELTLASGISYRFRKGDRIGLCPPIFHRDGEIFEHATEFHPSRWLQAQDPEERRITAETGKMPLFKRGREIPSGKAFLPFGAGATYCPGRRFARVELKTMLVFLLMEFEFQLPPELQGKKIDCLQFPGLDASRAGLGIFPPKHDIDMIITKRQIS